MRLIIDVDEKLVCEGFERSFTEEERAILIRAIENGIPYKEIGCFNCKHHRPYMTTDGRGDICNSCKKYNNWEDKVGDDNA